MKKVIFLATACQKHVICAMLVPMILLTQLFLGACMIGLTVFLHAVSLDLIIRKAKPLELFIQKRVILFWRPILSALIVVAIFIAHVIHMWLWAFLYMQMSCQGVETLPQALYFSTVTYTTLGSSNIDLGASCNMLSGIEGANGFLLFGWTTAFIFEVISQFYRREAKEL